MEAAALVLANLDDMVNTNNAFTVREISGKVPIAANADLDDSVDILHLAGSTYVLQFMNRCCRSTTSMPKRMPSFQAIRSASAD